MQTNICFLSYLVLTYHFVKLYWYSRFTKLMWLDIKNVTIDAKKVQKKNRKPFLSESYSYWSTLKLILWLISINLAE